MRLPSASRTKTLARDELIVIGAPGTPSQRVRRALADQCWILREEKSATRRELDGWMHRHRITPERSMVFDGPDAVKRAVMAGLGISMVSRLTVEDELTADRLVPLDIGLALPRRDVCVVDHPQKHHGAACSAMLRLFATRFEDRLEQGVHPRANLAG